MVYLMIILSSITILYITAFTVHLKSKMLCASLGKTLPIFIRAGLFVLCVNHHKCWNLLVVWQMEDSEGTVRQIGAFSEGIQNLTVRLSHPEYITLLRLTFQLLVVKLILFFVYTVPEHAERWWILQRDFKFTEPQRNRRGLQRMRLTAPQDLVLLWMKLCANPPLHSHTDLSQQTPRMLPHFFLVLHSKTSQKYYSVFPFSAYSPNFSWTLSPLLSSDNRVAFRATPLLFMNRDINLQETVI